MIIFNKGDALTSLQPSAIWSVQNNIITWLSPDIPQPSDVEINNEIERLQAEYNAKQYQRDRASEYPPLADQLDMLWHDRINNTDTWMEAIQAVKTKYPKS